MSNIYTIYYNLRNPQIQHLEDSNTPAGTNDIGNHSVEAPQGDFIYLADAQKAGIKERALNFFLSLPLVSSAFKHLYTAYISYKMSKLDAFDKLSYLNSFLHPENPHLIKFLKSAFKESLEKVCSTDNIERKKGYIFFINFPIYVKLDKGAYSQCKEILKNDIISVMKRQNYCISVPDCEEKISQDFIDISEEIVNDPRMANKVLSFHYDKNDQTALYQNGKLKWIQNLFKI